MNIKSTVSIVVPVILIASMPCPSLFFTLLTVILALTIAQLICTIPEVRTALLKRPALQRAASNEWFQSVDFGIRQIRPFIIAGVYLYMLTGLVAMILGHGHKPGSPTIKFEFTGAVLPKSVTHVDALLGFLLFLPLPLSVLIFNIVAARAVRKERNALKNSYAQLGEDGENAAIKIIQRPAKRDDLSESNFYHSSAFSVPFLLFFLSGIPAFFTAWLFKREHVDTYFRLTSHDQHLAFWLFFYFASVGACVATLFFRAWWTFPLNFYNFEHEIEFNKKGIWKRNIKGWLSELMWYTAPDVVPKDMTWQELEAIDYEQSGFGKLSPLPPGLFKKDSKIFKTLNRMAEVSDAFVDKLGRAEFIVFKSRYHKSFGGGIKVRLWDLSQDDRVRLYYAIRKWTPKTLLSKEIQEKLVGTTALSETRYTQIWYDVLTSKPTTNRVSSLRYGDQLQHGRYAIVDQLPSGGQANIYLAESNEGTRVIVKEFILASGGSVAALVESAADFENESTMLSSLDHPCIVKLLDSFAEERRMYLVLEHIDGKSLRTLVQENGTMAEADVQRLAVEMCDLLSYLHHLPVPLVHRDFTPDNLVLSADGHLRLIDFSVAFRGKNVKTSEFSGKHAYTPPEQFRGDPCTQSDIYALGATLSFLLTGNDPEPISRSSPKSEGVSISERFNAIIEGATELDLDKRFESADWLKLLLGESAPETEPEAEREAEMEQEAETQRKAGAESETQTEAEDQVIDVGSAVIKLKKQEIESRKN